MVENIDPILEAAAEEEVVVEGQPESTEDTTLTEEQEKMIYDHLEEEGTDFIQEEEEDTEEDEEEGLEEVELDPNDPGLNVEAEEQDYRETFKTYDVSEEEAVNLYKALMAMKAGEKFDYYEALPGKFKTIADNLRHISLQQGHPVSKQEAAKFVFADMTNDAQINAAFRQLNEELDKATKEMNTEYGKIFTEAYEEIFAKIDEIEATNPEQAAKIKRVKKAFEEAYDFSRLKEFVKTANVNKIRKKADNRFGDELYYFNKKVNVTDVKIPDISDLLGVMHNWMPQYNMDQLKRTIVAIIWHCCELDIDHDVVELVYIYRMINNIYSYQYLDQVNEPEKASEFFGNLASVVDLIIERLAEKT